MGHRLNECLRILEELSPMPDDGALTDDVLEKYGKVIADLELESDPRCIPGLVWSFGYGDGYGAYWSVVHLLERFLEEEVDPVLLEALETRQAGPCMWAARMLGRSGNTHAVAGLLSLLDHERPLVRRNAITALGKIGDVTTYPEIARLAHDPDADVRAAVARVLS